MLGRTIGILGIALMFLYSAGLGGCSEKVPQGELKILDHGLMTHEFAGGMPQSTAIVTGRAQNVGGSMISIAQIAVDFYDAGGSPVGNASAVTQNLGPGQIWYFSVQLTGPDAWKSVKYNIVASAR